LVASKSIENIPVTLVVAFDKGRSGGRECTEYGGDEGGAISSNTI